MNAREALKMSMETGNMVSMAYLDDLTDEDFMRRPHAGCNHINWQVGHLIASENQMVNGILPGSMPDLSDGFADRYTKETATSDDAAAFAPKEELLRVYNEQRAAAVVALDGLTDEQLDSAAPEEMQGYAPTFGAVFNLLGGHWLMHAGQWVIVRRELGRAPLF